MASEPLGPRRVSAMAARLVGSEILKIASEIRALVAKGFPVCNLTVGDFEPRHFPIPELLKSAIAKAYDEGQTNYPPSNGMPELREAIQRFYERELGLRYPLESILVASGARPVIYGVYRAIVDRGDRVLFPVPSWNNNHYTTMVDGEAVTIPCSPEHRFFPTREQIEAFLPEARLVCINTPLNPSGTAISEEMLGGISEAIVRENERRRACGERPVFLMYDQVYWMLTAPHTRHLVPPRLVPEVARYTIFVDGISKAFAATGLRVGWAVGPADVIERMSAILGHVGAWAPRPEQVAVAAFLDQPDSYRSYLEGFRRELSLRLEALDRGFRELKAQGHPVDSLGPEGAIYLTVRVFPFGKRTPKGEVLSSNEAIRRYLLEGAGIGVVPFQAFGYPGDSGWFRLSVGAVSLREIEEALPRLKEALRVLEPAD
ncbi:MAG: aminotransferase class I/II-fold pyridoxal phosphate-dependent enzyme [Deltaproteobacteria bacterium]|nr:aminotransferase class I/II-fold pyridoxal phosphate-dependent enzyme [Deltaproteobacteria bacterium]